MRKSDYIFIIISVVSASAFCVVSLLQSTSESILIEKNVDSSYSQLDDNLSNQSHPLHKQHRHRRGRSLSPTGKPTDTEKIIKMIQEGTLSNKEALFYKKLEDSIINKEKN
ncbi:MAG: hypothetical protein N3G21_13290 [Candidatus Hydrogenedentes bacterium]|nr:hypothetical protein [Candidatus Hydrogenedentota bacterium]